MALCCPPNCAGEPKHPMTFLGKRSGGDHGLIPSAGGCGASGVSTLHVAAPSCRTRHPSLPILVALFLFLLVGGADAWGSVGHEIVANLAWRLVSNDTRQAIASVLRPENSASSSSEHPPLATSCSATEPCSPLALVADWADQVRYWHGYHWSAPLHYIDVRDDLVSGGCPAISNAAKEASTSGGCHDDENDWAPSGRRRCTECFFNYTRDCAGDRCVAGAIVNYTQQLAAATAANVGAGHDEAAGAAKSFGRPDSPEQAPLPPPSTSEALKFLVHFVGDIHQPLHCSRTSDRGGNDIKVTWKVHSSPPRSAVSSADSADQRGRAKALPRLRSRARDGRYRRYRRGGGADDLLGRRSYSIDNLHAVWDDAFIDTTIKQEHGGSRIDLEDQLCRFIAQTMGDDDPATRERWTACPDGGLPECAASWGQESWESAIRFAYQDESGSPVVSGAVLGAEYYQSRLPIVRERLAAAGVRLASTLTTAFSPSSGEEQRVSLSLVVA